MQRLSRVLLSSAAGLGGSGGISAGNSGAARDTLTMANATTGFFGAALGVGTADDPAPGDIRHSSGLDSLPSSSEARVASMRGGGGTSTADRHQQILANSTERIDLSKTAEAMTEAQQRASPSAARKKDGFIVDRALYVSPPSTAAFLPDGRPNPNAEQQYDAQGNALMARRWSREASELCVEHTIRTRKSFTDFIVTYRWDDPNWRPILSLPAGNPIALEMRARHCNVSLKHIVQKGHAVYNIQHVQHSVLHPEGIAERAYVEISMPKADRLLTNIIHEGVLNAKDLGNVNAERGVIGISQVQGYANAFQRRPSLWQRSRRIGALQSEMGAIEWELHGSAEVGRTDANHVMLLSPHTKYVGGGVSTTAIVSSLQMAQHPHHYVAEFEAPATTIVDSLHQAAYLVARKNKLIKSDGSEQLHMLGSLSRTDFPFSPVELDLHYKIQMSAPMVFRSKEEYPSSLIGAPLLDGAPIFMCEYTISQGVSNYGYDEMPSALPQKWWTQKNTSPYVGNMYFGRSGQLGNLSVFEDIPNPFDKLGRSHAASTVGGRAAGGRRRGGSSSANNGAGGAAADDTTSSAEEAAEAFRRTVSSQLGDEELLSTSSGVASEVRRHYDAVRSTGVSNAVPPNERARGRMRRMTKALERQRGAVEGAPVAEQK